VRAPAARSRRLHHGDRDDIFLWPPGPDHLELLGLRNVTVYGITSTLFSEVLTYFPTRTSRSARSWRRSTSNLEGHGPLARAPRAGAVFRTVDAAGYACPARQRVPAALRRLARRLRDSPHPRGQRLPVLPTQAYLQITGLFDLRGGRGALPRAPLPGARGLPAAALLGRAPPLRDRHRQGRGAGAVRQHLARGRARRCSRSARW
jgi:hypothetical protein